VNRRQLRINNLEKLQYFAAPESPGNIQNLMPGDRPETALPVLT